MSITVKTPKIKEIVAKSNKSEEGVKSFIELVKHSTGTLQKRIPVIEDGIKRFYYIERRGIGVLNTVYGKFWQFSFDIHDHWEKYSVIVKANLDFETLTPIFKRKDHLVLRTDSGCESGQVFGDLTCDCGKQLKLAMQTISKAGEGIIVNIPHQDGRGMGLTFKLATLWLQDELKVNTIESAGILSHNGVIDVRTYSGVICILKFFGIETSCNIDLATNNPTKVNIFKENDYTVSKNLVPVVIKPTKYTVQHLQAKEKYLNHKGLIKKGEQCACIV